MTPRIRNGIIIQLIYHSALVFFCQINVRTTTLRGFSNLGSDVKWHIANGKTCHEYPLHKRGILTVEQ